MYILQHMDINAYHAYYSNGKNSMDKRIYKAFDLYQNGNISAFELSEIIAKADNDFHAYLQKAWTIDGKEVC